MDLSIGRVTTVPAAARALSVFEVFAAEQRHLTKSEVAKLLGIPESSSSDLLNTLYQIGYLGRTATTRRYYPTARLGEIAAALSSQVPLAEFGREVTAVLTDRTSETSSFTTLVRNRAHVLAVAVSDQRLQYLANVGDEFTLHANSAGKALLSCLSDDEAMTMLTSGPLESFTDNTLTDPKLVLEHVREQQDRGFFTSRDEGILGVGSISMSGVVAGHHVAMSVLAPTARLDAGQDRLLAVLREVHGQMF